MFDLISDLNINEYSIFDWRKKPTNPFCLVAGNVSSNHRFVWKTLEHLSKCYQGVFYIDGVLENQGKDRGTVIDSLSSICESIPGENVVYLYDNVPVFEGYAIVGANGWNLPTTDVATTQAMNTYYKEEDVAYLTATVTKMQKTTGVQNIVMLSGTPPTKKMYFGANDVPEEGIESSLVFDFKHLTKTWCFGGGVETEMRMAGIDFYCHPCHSNFYSPKPI